MITFTEKYCRIIDYVKILKVEFTEIHIQLKHINCNILGNNLTIHYLDKNEILIQGVIQKVEFSDENRV